MNNAVDAVANLMFYLQAMKDIAVSEPDIYV
jgi:hypothetical protein